MTPPRSLRTGSTLTRRSLLSAAGGLVATGLAPLACAQSLAKQRPTMLRLIANENPYGPSPAARAAANKAVTEGWKYAVRETGALKKLLAQHEGVSSQNIMVTAGSSEALRVAALAYGQHGGRMIAAVPTFSFLPGYARSLGCEVDEVALDSDMKHDLAAMSDAIRKDTRLIYVCQPNNPTGTLLDGKDLRAFISLASPRAPVVVDEAYLDLWDDIAEHTAVTAVREEQPVIVTRTFSKLHGMAGLRVGYAIARPDIINRLEALRVTQMSYVGVMAATASVQDQEFLDLSRQRIRECLQITTAALDELGRPYAPTRGNFVYFDTGGSPREFMGAMRKAGILTGMSYSPYPTWARVSMGHVEDMHVFADAAKQYFG